MIHQDAYPTLRDIRDEVHHEHTLLSQRVLWLVTSQSFLFVPLAVGIGASPTTHSDSIKLAKISDSLFFPLIPQLGILICIVAFIGILAAIWRINSWKHEQYVLQDNQNKTRWIVSFLGFVPALTLPLFIACAWFSILNDQNALYLWQWFAK